MNLVPMCHHVRCRVTLVTGRDALKIGSVTAEPGRGAPTCGRERKCDSCDACDAFSLFLSRAGFGFFRRGVKVRVRERGFNRWKRHMRHTRHPMVQHRCPCPLRRTPTWRGVAPGRAGVSLLERLQMFATQHNTGARVRPGRAVTCPKWFLPGRNRSRWRANPPQ